MTSPRPPHDKDPKPPSPGTPAEAARSVGAVPAPKDGTSYVFKIVPADPGRSGEFEDVADK